MKKTLSLLFIIILTLLFLLFHDKGNDFIKPYLSTYIESNLDNNMSVEIKTLRIDKKHIELIALLNKVTVIKVKGEVSILTQTLDLKYQVSSDGFNNQHISFKEKIDINGTITGSFDAIKVTGQGEALHSKINYQFLHKDKGIKQVEIDVDQANLAQVLLLLGQPAYASGKADVHVKIPSLDKENAKGTATIELFETEIHEKILKQEFNITIPPKSKLTAKINAKLQGEKIILNGKVQSTLANLSFKEAIYNLHKESFESDYKIYVKELKKLESFTQVPLYGSFELHGFTTYKGGIFSLRGESKSFEGTSFFSMRQEKLQLNLKAINLQKLLHFVGQKPYAKGGFSADVYIDNVKTLEGRFSLRTNIAKSINSTLKKELDIKLDKPVNFMLSVKGNIKKGIASINSDFLSDLFNLTSNHIKYDIKNASLEAPYRLDIPHLSKLKSLVGKDIKGKLEVKGNVKKAKKLEITGETKDLEGSINFKLEDSLLTSNIKDISVEKLMHMLIYPKVFKGKLEGTFDYDLSKKEGTLHSKLKQAQLLRSYLTVTVKDFKRIDLTKERYNESTLEAKFKQDIINLDFIAKSKSTIISLSPAKINKATNTIDGEYSLKINNNYINGTVKGAIQDPKITINASQAVQNEVLQQLDKQIDDGKLKDLGIGKEEKNLIKNIIQGFF